MINSLIPKPLIDSFNGFLIRFEYDNQIEIFFSYKETIKQTLIDCIEYISSQYGYTIQETIDNISLYNFSFDKIDMNKPETPISYKQTTIAYDKPAIDCKGILIDYYI